MLPSNKRLNRRDFLEILSTPGHIIVYNKLGTLKFVKNNQPALSVVISSKNEKKAVKRNLLKRRIYKIFADQKVDLRGILYVSKNSSNFSFPEIKELFNDLILKIKKNS